MISTKINVLGQCNERFTKIIREEGVILTEAERLITSINEQSAMDHVKRSMHKIKHELQEEMQISVDMARALERVRQAYSSAEKRVVDNCEGTIFMNKVRGIQNVTTRISESIRKVNIN